MSQPDTKLLRIVKRIESSSDDAGSSEKHENEVTEDDDEVMHRSLTGSQDLMVYDIVHSPSYQVPVLYITFRSNGQLLRSPPSLDKAYELFTPSSFLGQMKDVGVLGALSMTEHPVTGMTAFFVHPCKTAEAMTDITGDAETTPERYLMLWVGLIGPSVGLNVPVELAESMSTSM